MSKNNVLWQDLRQMSIKQKYGPAKVNAAFNSNVPTTLMQAFKLRAFKINTFWEKKYFQKMQSTCTVCKTITCLTRQLCHSHYKYQPWKENDT